jgi:ribosome biogenesis GTPase
MRELQLWDADSGVSKTFGDIESFSQSCRFKDCRHASEPGCAVREAVEAGYLPPGRLENYRKLQAELNFLQTKIDTRAFQARKKYVKRMTKAFNRMMKGGKNY